MSTTAFLEKNDAIDDRRFLSEPTPLDVELCAAGFIFGLATLLLSRFKIEGRRSRRKGLPA